MSDRIRRALVSTFDKTGVAAFCRELHEMGIEILSSGGTAKLLKSEGVPVIAVSDHTGSPEMLDGRVKTLHPKIHGGILAVRSNPEHASDLERHDIEPIDLVVVNLYPFEQTVAKPGAKHDEIVEMIDIGGPSMIRSAAKNHADVAVVVDPADYGAVIEEMRPDGTLSAGTRARLAAKAFAQTAGYDTAIHAYLSGQTGSPETETAFAESLRPEFVKVQELRYGENPHQKAAFYRDPSSTGPSVATATQLQGKELSFNNILDLDAALNLAAEFADTACAIIKHGNPCGAALGPDSATAFARALECDPVSAFGGVIAFNRVIDGDTATAISKAFYEAVIAPGFDDGALTALARKKKLRLLKTGELAGYARTGFDMRRVGGGVLLQEWDRGVATVREAKVATRREPTEDEWRTLDFAWRVVRHVKSNAIVYAHEQRTIGVGAGQMSRVDSARFGIQKAQVPLKGSVMASDAFFPFRDGVDVAAEAGVAAVIQPGGSIRDQEVIEAADEHDIAMVLTGQRHFRH